MQVEGGALSLPSSTTLRRTMYLPTLGYSVITPLYTPSPSSMSGYPHPSSSGWSITLTRPPLGVSTSTVASTLAPSTPSPPLVTLQ